MANSEDNRLDENCPRSAPGNRQKLRLKITTKCEFLTKPCRERKRYPREALKNSLGKKSLRGICAAAQNMSIHQAHPYRPEPSAQSNVFHRRLRRSPSATNKIAQAHPALVHPHTNIEHQKPLKDEDRNVTRYGVAAWRCRLRVRLGGVLKEPTNDGNSYKNRNKYNRMPRRGNERTTRGTRIEVRVYRCRFMDCTVGDQASSPCCAVDNTAHSQKEMVNCAQVKPDS